MLLIGMDSLVFNNYGFSIDQSSDTAIPKLCQQLRSEKGNLFQIYGSKFGAVQWNQPKATRTATLDAVPMIIKGWKYTSSMKSEVAAPTRARPRHQTTGTRMPNIPSPAATSINPPNSQRIPLMR